MGSVRFATRVLLQQPGHDPDWFRALARGMEKNHFRRAALRFREDDVLRLITRAAEVDLVSLARLFAVARTFMARVANELIPLQVDGRARLPDGSTCWHSQVRMNPPCRGKETVAIVLRARKNAPHGYKATRHGTCVGGDPKSQLFVRRMRSSGPGVFPPGGGGGAP